MTSKDSLLMNLIRLAAWAERLNGKHVELARGRDYDSVVRATSVHSIEVDVEK